MDVVHGLEEFPKERVPTVLALGTFDGVHRGHQRTISTAIRRAQELGGRSVVLTFDPHPVQVIAPPPEPFLLTTLDERLGLFAGLGVDIAMVVRFDRVVQETPADKWVDLLIHDVGISELVSSTDHTFGKDRGGTVELLRHRGQVEGFTVHTVPLVHVEGTLVSSTLIRRLLRAGEVYDAARYLGRWYTLAGLVIAGHHRGSALGFPTANLQVPAEKVLPARGAYASFVQGEMARYEAAVSVGTQPTFGPGPVVVEAHLLDFTGTLYGRRLVVEFVARLHDDIAFPTSEALVQQLHDDVARTRQRLRVAAVERLC